MTPEEESALLRSENADLTAQTTAHTSAYLTASCAGAPAVAVLAVYGRSAPHRSLPSFGCASHRTVDRASGCLIVRFKPLLYEYCFRVLRPSSCGLHTAGLSRPWRFGRSTLCAHRSWCGERASAQTDLARDHAECRRG